MVLLIIGVIITAVGFFISQSNPKAGGGGRLITIGGIVVAIIGFFTATAVIIPPGKVGVQTFFGDVSNTTLPSGFHLINPLVSVEEFDIQTLNYTMSATAKEGDVDGDDAIRVLTADGLEVVIDLTVLYHVLPSEAPAIRRQIGLDYKDKIVRPVTRTRIRDNAVYYDAVALYSTKRDTFQARIYNAIEKDFKGRGLVLEQLLIRKIDLPASVKASIESKINAEQDAQKMQFVLQKEKQEADRKRIEAQGIADYQKILSTGLSDKQLTYETIKANKEIALSPNTKIIIIGGNGKNTPLMINP